MSEGNRPLNLGASYADAPQFGTEVLHPNLDAGMDLYLVGEFLPSYAVSLARELAQTERIEPGQLNLVLGLPHGEEFDQAPATHLAQYLSKSIASHELAVQFLKDCLALMNERSMSFTLIRSKSGTQIAPGCVGLLSGRGSNSDSVIFTDRLPGDNNSPIHPKSDKGISDPNERNAFSEIVNIIEGAVFETSPGAIRIPQDIVLDLITEILKKRWLEKFYSETKPRKAKTSKRAPAASKSSSSWFEHQDLGKLLDEVNRGILNSDLTEDEFVKLYFGKEKQAAFYRFFGFNRL
jgi:hypothetical protein